MSILELSGPGSDFMYPGLMIRRLRIDDTSLILEYFLRLDRDTLRLRFGGTVGKAFLDMLAVFADFETNLRLERQMEGIAQTKKSGVYKGRKPLIDRDEIEKLQKKGLGALEIASQLGIARSSVYRIVNEAGINEPNADLETCRHDRRINFLTVAIAS